MPVITRSLLLAISLALGTSGCDPGGGPDDASAGDGGQVEEHCGPALGTVDRVIDGDTIVLTSGEKIRYLMVDTPEITLGKNECYGQEAADYNAEIVLGQEVELTYDVQCTDAYGRLLAYVNAPDGEINALLVARGYACVLEIPPNGEERSAEFASMADAAERAHTGLWGSCMNPCSP